MPPNDCAAEAGEISSIGIHLIPDDAVMDTEGDHNGKDLKVFPRTAFSAPPSATNKKKHA
jgi:hypothetical protein